MLSRMPTIELSRTALDGSVHKAHGPGCQVVCENTTDINYDRIGTAAATAITRRSLAGWLWPWWFRYGVMKEASSVWHDAAMRFESIGVEVGRCGGMLGGKAACWRRGGSCSLAS